VRHGSDFFWLGDPVLGLQRFIAKRPHLDGSSGSIASIGIFVRGAKVAEATGKQQESNPTMRIVLLILIAAVVLIGFASMFH
jgi:hypothetical protein